MRRSWEISSFDLPDVNFWLAFLDIDHTAHARTVRYWARERASKVGFCRVTMLGLFRLATSDAAMRGEPFSFPEIWRHYETLTGYDDVVFLHEPDLDEALRAATDSESFPNTNWTDAYLASFAIAGHHRLVTFDAGFERFARLATLILKG